MRCRSSYRRQMIFLQIIIYDKRSVFIMLTTYNLKMPHAVYGGENAMGSMSQKF